MSVLPTDPVTPTSFVTSSPAVDSYGTNWASKFNVKAVVLEMMQDGKQMEQRAARHLFEG
jgi:hypothetical protein